MLSIIFERKNAYLKNAYGKSFPKILTFLPHPSILNITEKTLASIFGVFFNTMASIQYGKVNK